MARTLLLSVAVTLAMASASHAQTEPQYNPGQDTVVVTRAADGSGAEINVREALTPADAAVLFGISPPPSSDAILIIEPGETPRWSTESLAEIDRELGGDGSVEIDLFPDDGPAPETRTQSGGDGRVASIFDGPRIQPRDGVWQTAQGEVQAVDCPSMISSNLSQFANAGTPPGPQSVTFDDPFDPAVLPGMSNLDLAWLPNGENSWIGGGNLAGAGGMSPYMQLTVTVVSPARIETVGVVQLNFPPQLVQTLGGGENCRTVVEGHMERIGD